MLLIGDLHEGYFFRRLSRFSGEMIVDRRRVLAHVPNSGRLRELLVPGRRVLLRRAGGRHRKTAYDLLHVARGRRWVCIDARLPPRLVEEAIQAGRIPELRGLNPYRREIKLAGGRIDLLLGGPGKLCYVETKAATLVKGRTAIFPDAPTDRGRRHLLALLRARRKGLMAAVLFVVQRADARRFAPNWRTDPVFAQMLVRVAEAGVGVLAYSCRVTRTGVKIAHPLPIRLTREAQDGVFVLDIP